MTGREALPGTKKGAAKPVFRVSKALWHNFIRATPVARPPLHGDAQAHENLFGKSALWGFPSLAWEGIIRLRQRVGQPSRLASGRPTGGHPSEAGGGQLRRTTETRFPPNSNPLGVSPPRGVCSAVGIVSWTLAVACQPHASDPSRRTDPFWRLWLDSLGDGEPA
jgi:hypothetical protein